MVPVAGEGCPVVIVEERLKWDEKLIRGIARWMEGHVKLALFVLSAVFLAVVALIFGG